MTPFAPLAVLFGLLCPLAAQGGVKAKETRFDFDALESFCESELERQKVPGFSLALVFEDQLAWSGGFGLANLETGARAHGRTVYRIGSVSKPLVATALMQLVAEGKVDLDEDVRTYVPEWPERTGAQADWTITVRHLCTHTSGIGHYRGFEFLSSKAYTDLVAPLEIYKDRPLLFEPGTKFRYSTYGFNLVGNVVENVSGKPIDEAMHERIFAPSFMHDTSAEDQRTIQRDRAGFYETDPQGNWRNAMHVDLSNKYAGGGITSTVEDLARFHIALQRDRLLSEGARAEMTTPYVFPDERKHRHGISWRVETRELPDGRFVRVVSHSGGSVGANTLFTRFPDHGFAFAMVCNHGVAFGPILDYVVENATAASLLQDR